MTRDVLTYAQHHVWDVCTVLTFGWTLVVASYLYSSWTLKMVQFSGTLNHEHYIVCNYTSNLSMALVGIYYKLLCTCIICSFYADVIDSGGDMKCLLCHTYQATIGSHCVDETAIPNACVVCGRTLSTAKTNDSTVMSSTAQLLVQSFDVTSLPADEFSLSHDLWQLWGQDQHQSNSSQEHLMTSPPHQQIVIPSSSSQRRKRSRSFGTKQIGF